MRVAMKGCVAWAAAVLLLPFLAAWDDDPEKMAKAKLKLHDRNKDGKISRGEWDDAEAFKKVDRDNDGHLSFEELYRHFKHGKDGSQDKEDRERKQAEFVKALKELRKFWDEIDTDRNDKISWDEVKRSKKDIKFQDFEDADTNEDGFVDIGEWGAFLRVRFGKNEPKNDPPKEKPKIEIKIRLKPIPKELDSEARAKIEKQSREKVDFQVKEYDANRDGKLSKEEWTGEREDFTDWDKNGDGYLGRDELINLFRDQLTRGAGMTEQQKE